MTRLLLATISLALLSEPTLVQSAVEDAFAVCPNPDRRIDEAIAKLEAKGRGLLTTGEVPETAPLHAAMQVIDRARSRG